MTNRLKSVFKKGLVVGLSLSIAVSGLLLTIPTSPVYETLAQTSYADEFSMTKLGSFQAASPNKDGGVAEIVTFNAENNKFYLVNGATQPPSMDIVQFAADGSATKDRSIDVKTLVETNGFVFGDLTSIDVNVKIDRVFVSVQAAGTADAGKIVEFDYDGNMLAEFPSGAQPDMIVSTADGRYVLTANEGEPRQAGVDPQGSVTILNTVTDSVQHLLFDNPSVIDEKVHIRGASDPVTGIITGKGTKADAIFDLEPEYITVTADSKFAFVTLQENNAIATVDLTTMSIVAVKGLGLKDHSLANQTLDLVRDNAIQMEQVPFYGIYNPDGVANFTLEGKTYLFTANEGDVTEWPGRTNASKISSLKGGLNLGSAAASFLSGKTKYDSMEVAPEWGNDSIYMFGGRSFSVWDAANMNQVYDSGNQFEQITAQRLPAHFNASHSKTAMDDRSTKKGPEPESIEIGKIGYRTFAFIGLERIGGVMVYDVSNPRLPKFVNYTNTRVFTPKDNLNTETGPEGLEFIPASKSPTGTPILLIANEVSGNVSIMQVNLSDSNPDTIQPSQPGKPSISDVGSAQIRITWTAAEDNYQVEGYRVFVNGVQRTTVKDPRAVIRNVEPATNYQITVQAFDRSRNGSIISDTLVFSSALSENAIIDTTAPEAPQNVQSSDVGTQGFRVTWTHAFDLIGIKEYEVYRNGNKIATVKHNAYRFSGIAPGRNNEIRILAVDHGGNKSSLSTPLQVTTLSLNEVVDTIAPQVPTNINVSQQTANGFRVTWTASTDNVFTLGYNVYLDGKYVASVGSPTYVFSGLTTNKSYQVEILAYDWKQNRSNKSTPISVTLSN
jgi:hypothetical protein